MRANVVLTLTGKDRIGLVDEVTQLLFKLGGNVETSRMARLGGEFAILMLVSMPEENVDQIEKYIVKLTAQGYKVTTSRTEKPYAETHPDWQPFRIEVHGADDEGLIHQIAHYLSQCGINIESMDTSTVQAPESGAPLFDMIAVVSVPPSLAGQDWEEKLSSLGHEMNLEVNVSDAKRQ
jgi:glycine cleavage system transcriptional repressor